MEHPRRDLTLAAVTTHLPGVTDRGTTIVGWWRGGSLALALAYLLFIGASLFHGCGCLLAFHAVGCVTHTTNLSTRANNSFTKWCLFLLYVYRNPFNILQFDIKYIYFVSTAKTSISFNNYLELLIYLIL